MCTWLLKKTRLVRVTKPSSMRSGDFPANTPHCFCCRQPAIFGFHRAPESGNHGTGKQIAPEFTSSVHYSPAHLAGVRAHPWTTWEASCTSNLVNCAWHSAGKVKGTKKTTTVNTKCFSDVCPSRRKPLPAQSLTCEASSPRPLN